MFKASRTEMDLVVASLTIVVGAGAWISYLTLRQNGRIQIRLEAIEQELVIARVFNEQRREGSPRTDSHSGPDNALHNSRIDRGGLVPGVPAPTFSLPRADDGGQVSLDDYRGAPFLLVFSDPECAPCAEAWEVLGSLARQHDEISILLISRGSLDRTREKYVRMDPPFVVAAQKKWEVSRQYATFKLPSGYLVDSKGIIASPVAVGVDALVGLGNRLVNVG